MPATISLTNNPFLSANGFLQQQERHLAVVKKRIQANLSHYKNLLAALEAYTQAHLADEIDALVQLFGQKEYSEEVVKCARSAYFEDEKLAPNPLFLLASNLADFLKTVSESTDPFTISFAHHAILLVHDMFNHHLAYDYGDMKSLSKTFIAAGTYYQHPADHHKQRNFANAVSHFTAIVDNKSKFDKFILKHPSLSTFIAAALAVTAIVSLIFMPLLAPLVAGSLALSAILMATGLSLITTGLAGVIGFIHTVEGRDRLQNPVLMYRDKLIDDTLVSLKSSVKHGLFAARPTSLYIKTNEEPLLEQSEQHGRLALI